MSGRTAVRGVLQLAVYVASFVAVRFAWRAGLLPQFGGVGPLAVTLAFIAAVAVLTLPSQVQLSRRLMRLGHPLPGVGWLSNADQLRFVFSSEDFDDPNVAALKEKCRANMIVMVPSFVLVLVASSIVGP